MIKNRKIGKYTVVEYDPQGETMLSHEDERLLISLYGEKYKVEKYYKADSIKIYALSLDESDLDIAKKLIVELKKELAYHIYMNDTVASIRYIAEQVGLSYSAVYSYIRIKNTKEMIK